MHFRVLVDLLSSSFDFGFLESFFFSSWPSGVSGSCWHKTEGSESLISPLPPHSWWLNSYDTDTRTIWKLVCPTQHILASNTLPWYGRVHVKTCTYCPYGYVIPQIRSLRVRAAVSLCLDYRTGIVPQETLPGLVNTAAEQIPTLSRRTPVSMKFHARWFYDIVSKLLM